MSIKFDGKLDVVDVQRDLIVDIVRKQGLNDCTVKVEPVGSLGDNFASNVIRLTAKDEEKTFSMVVKVAPTTEFLRTLLSIGQMFTHETLMYMEVLPKMVELQKSAGVTTKDLLRYPLCYGVVTEAPYETLALEDLKVEGNEMRDKFVSLSNEEVKSALKLLATFHSMSIVLREKEPNFYENIKSRIVELKTFRDWSDERLLFIKTLEENTYTILRDDQKDIAKDFVYGSIFENIELVEADINEKHVGLSHGDCWSNNFMFKEMEDGTIKSVLIDFQVLHQRSPVADVQYFIFASTDRETRSKFYNDWLEYYYSQYEKSLSYFHIKASFYFPKERFQSDLKRWAKANYGSLIFFFNLVIKETDDQIPLQNFTEEEMQAMMETTKSADNAFAIENMKGSVDKLRKRIRDVTDCFIDFGYFRQTD